MKFEAVTPNEVISFKIILSYTSNGVLSSTLIKKFSSYKKRAARSS